jgi:putative colanic acid biosynthesis UDP-glucose lipid carrier transferase
MPELFTQRRDNVSSIYTFDNASVLYPVYASVSDRAEVANNSITKRIVDIVFTIILFCTVFIWLFPLIALIIKLTSKGPVFFAQQRTGLNGTSIYCYKFRTMEDGCKSVDHTGKYLQAVKNDPRVTRIGSILRRTSLDELPQFWNVLKGDMTIVGPRPHPEELNKECEGVIDKYELRYLIKPGITGVAQVRGYRGGTPNVHLMQARINHDIWYIRNWSILLDVKIMFLTGYTIFAGDENAY